MKKIISLVLVALLMFACVACAGGNNNEAKPSDENTTSVAENALEIMTKAWDGIPEEAKFPVAGGDLDAAVMDAPGAYGLEDKEALDADFGVTEDALALITEAASLKHMMNANSFTAVAFKSTNTDELAKSLKDSLLDRQWICGAPEKLIITVIGEYVVLTFGAEDILKDFQTSLTAAFESADVVCDEAITLA